ncbi:MAG: hypothetical protein A07HN63_02165 [uncultured archaeon A07HN63]|jgi:hypothetical protein|nr:MAG: hypothetical protein A07HN63_02165 [uncultured archaeon A07HN63]
MTEVLPFHPPTELREIVGILTLGDDPDDSHSVATDLVYNTVACIANPFTVEIVAIRTRQILQMPLWQASPLDFLSPVVDLFQDTLGMIRIVRLNRCYIIPRTL